MTKKTHLLPKNKDVGKENSILLCLMPFWAPLIPPLGISLLKAHLQQYGVKVVTYDFNTHDELWEVQDKYFKIVKEIVPQHKHGNFYMVGFDVLSNHLTAYLHKTREKKYRQLVKHLFMENYYETIDVNIINVLDKVIEEFFSSLQRILLKVLNKFKPNIFGITVYSTSMAAALYAFQLVKEKFPTIETMMGGGIFADQLDLNSPDFPRFQQRTEPYLDTIIAGEGEILLEKYLSGSLDRGNYQEVYSLGHAGELLDLKTAVPPDFSDFNLAAYSQMAVYTSRSCPYQCNFCSETVQWGKFRKKNPEQVVNEITAIKNRYGGKLFLFGDSLVNPFIDKLSHSLLKNGADIFWDGYLRADPEVCDLENSRLWRESGFYRARLGIESGSPHVLDLMNKKITVEQICKALSNLANNGIKTTTYWVVGYPGETETDFQDTLYLLKEMKNQIYEADWHPFYFFPRGQVGSTQWAQDKGCHELYPEEFSEMIISPTWVLKAYPGRKEIYHRMNRFAKTCKELNIPNPYSIMEIYQADKRWQKLHPECGPTLINLHNCRHLHS